MLPNNAEVNHDFITILSSAERGKILTKRHTPTGTINSDKGTWFTSREISIASLDDLAAALDCKPTECVILGKIRDNVEAGCPHLRRLHARVNDKATYQAVAHRFAIVDVDEKETPIGWHNDLRSRSSVLSNGYRRSSATSI